MKSLLLFLVILSSIARGSAQEPSRYVYSRPGDPIIQVTVEGNVENPGVYILPKKCGLKMLLGLAGGPGPAKNDIVGGTLPYAIIVYRQSNGEEARIKFKTQELLSFETDDFELLQGDRIGFHIAIF